MVVRGAPAIGVAAAMGVALAAYRIPAPGDREQLLEEIEKAADGLRRTRPTAVNLFWGIRQGSRDGKEGRAQCQRHTGLPRSRRRRGWPRRTWRPTGGWGAFGSRLLEDGDVVMTQCNAGALATVGYGTALGVIRAAREAGKVREGHRERDDARALQGSRLTAFELVRDGFHCTLISDTAVGFMMSSGRVDKVIVGADRITRDGYVFNKIGTYQVAVLANRHGVPFYVAAPGRPST